MRSAHNGRIDNRAVAPIIGQALLFGLVITAVLTVTAVGIPVLQDQQADVQQTQAEEAVVDIDAAISEAVGTKQNTTSTIDVPAGTTQTGGNKTVISVSDGSQDHTFTTEPIQVTAGDRTITSEAGLIATTSETPGATPQIRHVPDETRVGASDPIYQIQLLAVNQTGSPRQITNGRASEVELQIRPQTNTTTSTFEGSDGASITITTSNPRMWERYIDNHPAFENPTRSGNAVSGTIDSDTTVRITAPQLIID